MRAHFAPVELANPANSPSSFQLPVDDKSSYAVIDNLRH
jgi:hypothetical protein